MVVSPRARQEIVRPRLQLDARARPLNFTVRPHASPAFARSATSFLAAAPAKVSSMPIVTVKRFVQIFPQGGRTHYSIRRRDHGSFQLYHDDPFAGIPQPYEFDYRQISGRFADVPSAEAELLRMYPDLKIDV